jgi:hypothetical protein
MLDDCDPTDVAGWAPQRLFEEGGKVSARSSRRFLS